MKKMEIENIEHDIFIKKFNRLSTVSPLCLLTVTGYIRKKTKEQLTH